MRFPKLNESQAPTVDGPVYARLNLGGTRLMLGSEFQLDARQVDAWIAMLLDAKSRMVSAQSNVALLRNEDSDL